MAGGGPRWLLIGNSRWHWASIVGDGLVQEHSAPASAPLPPLQAWAAVGPVPAAAGLPPQRRLLLTDVPLRQAPPWLGIDRALGGWQAWREFGGPVLVADAGTVLSLTRVDREGRFAGGRLMAGVALQLQAMAAGTAALPSSDGLPAAAGPPGPDPWPGATQQAMAEGVRRGLAAAVAAAALELVGLEPSLQLVITGGDGGQLLPLIEAGLASQGLEALLRPELCLEALVTLRPVSPGRDR